MGPRDRIKGTYSRARQDPPAKENIPKKKKIRRVVPQFDNLFVKKNVPVHQETDPFDSVAEVKKESDVKESVGVVTSESESFRRPLAVSGLFGNSTIGSVGGHSSANDTFDRLVSKGKKVAINQLKDNGMLSSSNSCFDATGLLYQSLRSHAQSHLHSSSPSDWSSIHKEISKVKEVPTKQAYSHESHLHSASIHKEISKVKEVPMQPYVLLERITFNTDASKERVKVSGKERRSQLTSPQLFSSSDERQCVRTVSVRPRKKKSIVKVATKGRKSQFTSSHLFSSGEETESVRTVAVRPRKKKSIVTRKKRNHGKSSSGVKRKGSVKVMTDITNIPQKSSALNDCDDCCLGTNHRDGSIRPEIVVRQPEILSSPEVDKGVPCLDKLSVKADGLSCTPLSDSFRKSLLHQRLLTSQKRMLPGSQFSGGSHGSCLSSNRSDVLTSTPADTSHAKFFSDSFGPWDTQNEILSPVPRQHFDIETNLTLNFSGFASPPLGTRNTKSIPNQKCRENHSCESDYHTCVSHEIGGSDICKPEKSFNQQKIECSDKNNILDSATPSSFYNCITELKTGPFKGCSIPLFTPARESKGESCGCKRTESKGQIVENSNIENGRSQLVSGDEFIHGIPKDFPAEKWKEINSFLNKDSFSKPMKTQHQKRKFAENKVKPLPLLKRLSHQTARLSRFHPRRPSRSSKECSDLSYKGGTTTDMSTATEPSFVLPRRISKLSARQTKRRNAGMKAVVETSNDSVYSNQSVILSKHDSLHSSTSSHVNGSPIFARRSVRLASKKNSIRNTHVSTRSTAKRLQTQRKMLSIMQFSLSSLKSTITDTEESVSKPCIKDVTLNSESTCNIAAEREQVVSEDEVKSSLLGVHGPLKSPLANELSEYQVVNQDSDYSAASESIGVSEFGDNVLMKSSLVSSVMENTEKSKFEESLDDFFLFQAPLPVKRGKGWIRSLSIARASLIGSEQNADTRRNTVHRMSFGGRRMTVLPTSFYPEVSESCIQEVEESFDEDIDLINSSILTDPKRHVLTLCSQREPVPVGDCFTESRLSCCRKIGEGVYGEVFMTKPNPKNMDGATVLKIMPIEGDFEVNGEAQKKFEEILSEIIISMELSNLRKYAGGNNWTENFVHVLNCWCVEGRYHPDMLQLWDMYHEKKGSENDRPDIFPDSQLYIVLEFTHGGQDLEGFIFNNSVQSLAIFHQIAYSLAVAEQALEFEHRDLHWGNVLVATTNETTIDFRISGGTYSLQTQGVKATVIDFTLSRLKAPHCTMFNNLAEDPSLFTAHGDYQFDIYRAMKKTNKNNWESFNPYTNVLWLHYILDKMISDCYYKNVKSKVHNNNIEELNKLKNTMLMAESATAFVLRREHGID